MTQLHANNREKAPIAIVCANLKGNLGDFAILHAMLLDIQESSPGHPIHVYPHGFVPVDQQRLAAFRSVVPPFEMIEAAFPNPHPPSRKLQRLLRAVRLVPFYQAARIRALAAASEKRAAGFSQYHAVYIAGGAQWTGAISGVSMFATLHAIAAHTDRIFSYPVSVSASLVDMNSPSSLRRNLGRIRGPLLARDSASQKTLAGLGLACILGADCVFSLAEAAAQVMPASRPARPRVVFLVTGQKPEAIAAALRTTAAAGLEAALLTTCALEDAAVQKPVADAAGAAFLAPLTWQDCVAELKASDLVVTNRLHGFILSSLAEVPVLPLTDRPKVRAVVEDAGLSLEIPVLKLLDDRIIRSALEQEARIVAQVTAYRDEARKAIRGPLDPRLPSGSLAPDGAKPAP